LVKILSRLNRYFQFSGDFIGCFAVAHTQLSLRDWSKRLGVTPERLKELVKEHGPIAANIRKALGKQ
jgi:plasmid maintenance system antidote protein VapI